jgi:hypothetical protein
MNRRGFLGAILAAASAPAIVRAQSLMPTRSGILVPEPTKLWVPKAYGGGRAGGKVIQTSGGHIGFVIGDLFTIAGVSGVFRATSITDSGTVGLEPAIMPVLPTSDQRFSDDPWS